MHHRNVLISGASVAGLTLAYWLQRAGFRPTVVERAPGLRKGGQAIDIRGSALQVMDRMNLLDKVRSVTTGMRGMSVVDGDGVELSRSTEETFTGGVIDNDDVELMRDDLTTLLFDVSRYGTEFLFDDVITAIAQDDDGVEVRFQHERPRRFALVIGADGLHSGVRRLVFGPESSYLRFLGSYLAIFSVDNFLALDHWQTFHMTPEELVGVYSTRDNTEARAILLFHSPELDIDHRDPVRHRALVAERFAGVGWETPRLLERMGSAPDFYFDSMSQVRLDHWSKGRVTLVGDAGYCPSPRSGQGTSLALAGAYVLAGELGNSPHDHRGAFARYELLTRDYVHRNQRLAQNRSGDSRPSPVELARAANSLTLPAYPCRG
ncbi:FAD-dependent monooxygenase [Streptomyces sp. NPDC006660]|uniref:FAD-dependent monooxygenase n=1 Tax=unclassified Streptomyces TaxID=2593676 RepID=UPI0033D26E58